MATKTKMQVNTWEQRLADSAAVAAKAEQKNIERPFFSFSGGKMSLRGAQIPNNEAPVVVLDAIHTNLYYHGKYDPNNPVPPKCYAYGRTDESGELVGIETWNGKTAMAPHKDVKERMCDTCDACPMNQWGSGNGQGKACQNVRRLAMIPAGTFVNGQFKAYDKPEQIEDAQLAYVKLPVMSCKNFSSYVMDVAQAMFRPTWGVFTRMARVDDSRSQFAVTFEALGNIPHALMDAVFKRVEKAEAEIAFPFQPASEAASQPKSKAVAGKRRYT